LGEGYSFTLLNSNMLLTIL